MHRRTTAATLAGLTIVALTACSSTAGDDGGTSAPGDAGEVALVEPGVLTMCTNPPFPPFEYEEGGEVVGIDVDVVGEVAADLGVEVDIVVTPFEGIETGADLDAGNCDVVASGVTITEEREERMDFSEPYFDADQGLLAPTTAGLDAVEDLEGLRVAVQQATTGEAWATEQGLQTVQFEDLGLQVEALRSGQVDAVVNDVAVLGAYVDDELEIGTTFPTGEQYGLGVRTGNSALLEAIDATLERIASDGTFDEIYTTHVGTPPTED